MSKESIDTLLKRCIYVLLALCFVLAITSISLACLSNERGEIGHFNASWKIQSRILDSPQELNIMSSSCQITNCTIECNSSTKVFEEVFQVLQTSECEENIILKLDNQHFPNFILTNRWISANKIITSLIINNSQFTHIRNEAFNSFDFTGTQAVTLLGVKLKTLGNGVLLGFARLKSIRLEGKVRQIDRCFFQPVQASLIRLTLRADLTISGSENIFGISYMLHLHALDLSENCITGSLSRSFFLAVPKLRYLILSDAKITSIDVDAFDDIASQLALLDLSNNHLLTLDPKSVEQILVAGKVKIYLLGNEWQCDNNLKPLISLYSEYADCFGDLPYCRTPPSCYGTLFTDFGFDQDCELQNDTNANLIMHTPIEYYKTDSLIASTASTEDSVAKNDLLFKMACLSVVGLADTQELSTNMADDGGSDPVEYFLFAPPCHDFELKLLNNNSVRVTIQNADEPINIIWFSEALENFVHTVNDITIDYNCEMYSDPFLIADNLEDNCTYTFCLVPSGTFSITPFNCLPLHVPSKVKLEPSIWISHDDKELTLGLICLILLCSLLFGAVLAYYGIKAYPDILAGSNRVLLVKKSNKAACYVATITEGEYKCHKKSLKKKSSLHAQGILTPPAPLPCRNNVEAMWRESVEEPEDYYEMPCVYNQTHNCQQKCLSNDKCVKTPSSPPPLPKRNSDSILFGLASERVRVVPHPNLSL